MESESRQGPRKHAAPRSEADRLTEQLRAAAEREELLDRERKAREQVTTILESITDAFFALDRWWRFTYVNKEAERVLERSRDELLEAAATAFYREYHHAMAQQLTADFEGFYPPRQTWYEVRAYPSPEGLSVYFRDVTERRRAEQELKASEERYRLLADMIPQHIWTTDARGYHGYFSRRWYDYTGASPEQTQGEGYLELLHPADRQRTLARWQHSLRTGEPYAIEYRVRRADGKYCWFLAQAMPMRSEAGDIVRWFGTLTDISQRKRLERERERLLARERQARAEAERRRDELECVTESRARLIRGFSHDVKNPLGAADGYLHLMSVMDDLTLKQQERVLKVRRSIKAAVNLIEDLLELARAESGELEIARAPTDLLDVVREAVEEYRAQAEAARLSLTIELPDELPVIESDRNRIRQVVGNLLSNAVKYTEDGGITVRVMTSGGRTAPRPGRWITVDVADTGRGIPEEQQRLLFQEFRRLDTGEAKGAGIGLSISRRIAEALGGDITLESEIGKGSTFTLWLPCESASSAS
jgi:PAS domain S-box-containing protein